MVQMWSNMGCPQSGLKFCFSCFLGVWGQRRPRVVPGWFQGGPNDLPSHLQKLKFCLRWIHKYIMFHSQNKSMIIYDTYMIHRSYINDTPMLHIGFTNDTYMIHIFYITDTYMYHTWYTHDTCMILIHTVACSGYKWYVYVTYNVHIS